MKTSSRIYRPAVALAVGALLLVGCGSQPTKPQAGADRSGTSATPSWITQPPRQSGMAYGIGSMEIYGSATDAVQRAAELARIDLVSQLRVTVSGDFSSDITETSGTGRTTDVQRNVRSHARSQVPEVQLDEVVIRETHTDARYAYALAELDRQAAAARLRRDIDAQETELRRINALAPAGNTLQQLQPLLPALTVFASREKSVEQLALVSTSRASLALPDDLRALQQRIDTLVDQLKVAVELLDRGAAEISGNVIEALTSQGLRVHDSEHADLIFFVNATLSHREQDRSHYVFIDSRVTIRDQQGRALSSFSKQARGVSGIEAVARQTAARNVGQMLSTELAATLVDHLR